MLNSKDPEKLDIKIIDFGTARILAPDQKLTSTVGEAYYISPEMLAGRYDEKCDIWSCGVTLYMLLSGTPPFFGKTSEDIVRAVKATKFSYYGTTLPVHDIAPVWTKVSDSAKDLINRMLTCPAEKRITAKEACQHEWVCGNRTKRNAEVELDIFRGVLSQLSHFHVRILHDITS